MCALCVVLQAVYKVVEHEKVKLPVLERVKENDTGDVMMSDMAVSSDVSACDTPSFASLCKTVTSACVVFQGALVASGPIEGAECTIFAVDRTDNT